MAFLPWQPVVTSLGIIVSCPWYASATTTTAVSTILLCRNTHTSATTILQYFNVEILIRHHHQCRFFVQYWNTTRAVSAILQSRNTDTSNRAVSTILYRTNICQHRHHLHNTSQNKLVPMHQGATWNPKQRAVFCSHRLRPFKWLPRPLPLWAVHIFVLFFVFSFSYRLRSF